MSPPTDALAVPSAPGSAEAEVEAVRAELARARAQVLRSVEALRVDLRPLQQVRASVRRHPWLWLGGALALGVALGAWTRKT